AVGAGHAAPEPVVRLAAEKRALLAVTGGARRAVAAGADRLAVRIQQTLFLTIGRAGGRLRGGVGLRHHATAGGDARGAAPAAERAPAVMLGLVAQVDAGRYFTAARAAGHVHRSCAFRAAPRPTPGLDARAGVPRLAAGIGEAARLAQTH